MIITSPQLITTMSFRRTTNNLGLKYLYINNACMQQTLFINLIYLIVEEKSSRYIVGKQVHGKFRHCFVGLIIIFYIQQINVNIYIYVYILYGHFLLNFEFGNCFYQANLCAIIHSCRVAHFVLKLGSSPRIKVPIFNQVHEDEHDVYVYVDLSMWANEFVLSIA